MRKKCDKVFKFSHFGWGYFTCNGSGEQTTKRSTCLEQFSSSIDKVSFKRNSMSVNLILLEEKLFTWTRMYTLQSDAIMSASLKIASEMPVPHSLGKYFQHHEIQKHCTSTKFRILSEHCQLYKVPKNV